MYLILFDVSPVTWTVAGLLVSRTKAAYSAAFFNFSLNARSWSMIGKNVSFSQFLEITAIMDSIYFSQSNVFVYLFDTLLSDKIYY